MNFMPWIFGCILMIFLLSGCNEQAITADEKADPVLVEYPVVYIERSVIKADEDANAPVTFSTNNPAEFNAGAQLLIKNNAFANSPSSNLTNQLFVDEQGNSLAIDIRDLSISDDGQEFLVSIRAPENPDLDEEEQAKWNIWRYQLATKSLTRVIPSDVIAEQGDDLMASYLPDGRIIFASTRQRLSRAILLDEGKPQYTALNEIGQEAAFNLHVMQSDGSDIKQISFNMSNDFYPLVLQDGRILYSRWDTMGGNNKVNLYRMNPDGTENHLVFGWHSQQVPLDGENETIQLIKPQQLPNGDILLLLNSRDEESYQKRPVVVDINNFIDYQQSISTDNTTEVAQQDFFQGDLFQFNFSSNINANGRLNALFPLPDSSERYLLSWDLCRVEVLAEIKACGQLTAEELAQETVSLATPWYELWLYNAQTNTQQLVAKTTEGNMLTESVVMQASETRKNFIEDKSFANGLSAELANQQAGAIHIRSVYDFDGIDTSITENNPTGIVTLSDPSITPADNLPARFIRVVRGVPMPPRSVREVSNTDFGRSRNQLMREIVGYSVVQPDGSVKIKVPANVPIALSILDKNGQRVGGRHRQWISVKAGETLECNGCHTASSEQSHGRIDAKLNSINQGATGGNAFTNATPSIVPIQGQTMAQADELINGIAQLTADISYQDIWTDTEKSNLNPEISYQYAQLETPAPTGSNCYTQWNAYCRIQINYVEHIQPLWQLPREELDEQTSELIADNTCSSCHSPMDSDNVARVPAGQLDLSDSGSIDEADHLTAYRELLFNDAVQEVIEGIVVDKLVAVEDENGNTVFELNAEGELILDAQGQPIPVMTNINQPAILSTNGALASEGFFTLFQQGRHKDMLTEHELKLLSEWLDIGAQYYNTPFYLQE